MALKLSLPKAEFDTLDTVIQKEYELKGDVYVLDARTGDDKNARDELKRFRDSAVEKDKKITAFETKFKDVDVEKYTLLLSKETELTTGEVYKKEGLDKAVAASTAALKLEHEKQLKAATESALVLQRELEKVTIDGELAKHAADMGAMPNALDLIAAAHRGKYKLIDGKPFIMEADGTTKKYGANGEPMTTKELLEQEAKERPYLFKPSNGAGSSGSGGNKDSGIEDPFAKGTWSTTKQQALLGSDKPEDVALGKRLAAKNGVKIPT
jgi:hypothetical protein